MLQMKKNDEITLNYYSQGIVKTETVPEEKLKERRSQLSQQGYTCWITRKSSQSNQQYRFV
jgi:hypothetical protein